MPMYTPDAQEPEAFSLHVPDKSVQSRGVSMAPQSVENRGLEADQSASQAESYEDFSKSNKQEPSITEHVLLFDEQMRSADDQNHNTGQDREPKSNQGVLVRIEVPLPSSPYDDPDAIGKITTSVLSSGLASSLSMSSSIGMFMWDGVVRQRNHQIIEFKTTVNYVDQLKEQISKYHPDRRPSFTIMMTM